MTGALSLSVLRCPDGVPPETRKIESGDFTVGRGTENDWVLADPERVLSKRHCVLSFRSGAWQLIDTSTNGTFLNHETERVGPDAPRVLRDGDRLIIGAYEIEVALNGHAAHPFATPAAVPDTRFKEDRITSDPFPTPERSPLSIAIEPVGLPADFDPLGLSAESFSRALPVADHLPAFQESYQLPRSSLELLPDDWDAPSVVPPPAAAPAAPIPAAPPAPEPPRTPAAGGDGLKDALALILAGAKLKGAPEGEAADALDTIGQAFRAMVAGLRRLMIARATVKGEFRIGQTMIKAIRNNPLKFSANDDDALAALLGIGRRSDMSAAESVADALRDMRLHELAVSAAMQQAMREVLAELEPARLIGRLPPESLDGLPGRRKARAWDAFEAQHARTVQALADDFDSVFGKSFARAYERAMQEIAAADPPTSGAEGE